jgi:tetratricopeptide (TPR) repeat protein
MKLLSNHSIGIAVCCSFLVGCMSIQETNTLRPVVRTTQKNTSASTSNGSARLYIFKASAFETEGDLQMALYHLKIASTLAADKNEIAKKISELEKRLSQKADIYFKEGIKLYQQHQMEKARMAFVNTLRYDPEHKKAWHYLNTKFSPFKFISYTVEKGDTKKDIANTVFSDPDKAFLISYFGGDGDDEKSLQKGMTLDLPYLASIPVKQQAKKAVPAVKTPLLVQPPEKEVSSPLTTTPGLMEKPPAEMFDVESELARAEGLLKENRYDRALAAAEKILNHDYFNIEAEELINRVYFQKGESLFYRERYLEAQTTFGYVDPEFIPTREVLAKIKTKLEKQAETHYLKGVKYFINEALENAILEWETVLKLNPAHEKARNDIQNANQLLEKLKAIE